MKIKNKENASVSTPNQVFIRRYESSRLTFNFSFLTEDIDYNLSKKNKHLNNKVKLKLLDKIKLLSEEDMALLFCKSKEQGLELLPEAQVSLKINNEFKNSSRYDKCKDGFFVFRLNKLGRVIGKIDNSIFYILAIDTKFELYKH